MFIVQFHAYFPTANSYPAIVADILSGAIACIGFSWIASPACTELEMVSTPGYIVVQY